MGGPTSGQSSKESECAHKGRREEFDPRDKRAISLSDWSKPHNNFGGSRREEKAFGAADERIAAFVEAQEPIGGVSDADADGFSDWPQGMANFAQRERGGSAEIQAVVAAPDLKGGSKASRAAREIEKPGVLAVALHELDALEWFESPDEDCRCGSSRFAHDIEHEMRAVIEKNVGVAVGEIHRMNARSWAAKVMSGGIAGRIGFRFHDAPAETARGEIVDDNFSDEEVRQLDGISRKLSATETADH